MLQIVDKLQGALEKYN